jgi:ABC-type bacteriocin/lantibiotic exporter with double-glycine peptidase domain
MAHCINLSHPEFQQMASQVDIPAIELAARINVWQDKNDTDEFPKLEDIEFERISDDQYKNTRINNTVEQIEANRKKEIADFVTNKKQPDVILPIGTSGSGKSTFIKSINKDIIFAAFPLIDP